MITITQIIRPTRIRAWFIRCMQVHVPTLMAMGFGYMAVEIGMPHTSSSASTYSLVIIAMIVIAIQASIIFSQTMDWRRDQFSVIIATNGMGAQSVGKGFRAPFANGHHMIDKADDIQPELMPRNWLQRLLGGYFIMGKDGKGFMFDPRLFSKEQLKIIKAKLQEFYGLAL